MGPLTIKRSNGSLLDCSADGEVCLQLSILSDVTALTLRHHLPQGTLIPSDKELGELDMSEVRWILVIEKEVPLILL